MRMRSQKSFSGTIATIADVRFISTRKFNVDKPWWEYNVWSFDVETTGLDPVNQRIVEIGLSKREGKEFLEGESHLINDGVPIPQELLDKQINDITNEMLEDKPTFEEVFNDRLEEILTQEDLLFISYNAFFDAPFLWNSLKRIGKEDLMPTFLCAYDLARKTAEHEKAGRILRQLPNLKLNTLYNFFMNKAEQTHRAGQDAQWAGIVFLKLARKHPDWRSQEVKTLADALEFMDEVCEFRLRNYRF